MDQFNALVQRAGEEAFAALASPVTERFFAALLEALGSFIGALIAALLA